MAWNGLTTVYEIKDARIVVAVRNGGAIVEQRDMEYHEGRYPSEYLNDASCSVPCLDMQYLFNETGADSPDCMVTIQGRIVIDGTTKDGPIEIRGFGEFGYDEHGRVQGNFDALPVILLDEIVQDEVPDDAKEMTRREWVDHMARTKPKPSAQFERATRGTWPDDGDDDD